MDNQSDSVPGWGSLIERYVRARRRSLARADDAESTRDIAREGFLMLNDLDAAGIGVLRDALADSEKRWFVGEMFSFTYRHDRPETGVLRFYLHGTPVPEGLFEPMLYASVAHSIASSLMSSTSWFVTPTCLSFGFRRCAEFFIRYLSSASREEVSYMQFVLGSLHPTHFRRDPSEEEPGEGRIRMIYPDYAGEGLVDIRAALIDALDQARRRVSTVTPPHHSV
jgi:hypothetical protein